MAFKTYKKQDNRIDFRNGSGLVAKDVEKKFNPVKQYYGIVLVDGKEKLYKYPAKFRSEAIAVLEEEARLDGGKLLSVGVFKN